MFLQGKFFTFKNIIFFATILKIQNIDFFNWIYMQILNFSQIPVKSFRNKVNFGLGSAFKI